jgi:hypothetical protein
MGSPIPWTKAASDSPGQWGIELQMPYSILCLIQMAKQAIAKAKVPVAQEARLAIDMVPQSK